MTADASGAAADIITSMDDALARVAQLAQSAFDDVEGSAQGSADGMSEAARRAATTMSNALAGIDTSGLQNSLSETARLTAQVEDVARAAAAARRDETEAARAANRAEDELISTLQDVNATTEQVAQATQAAVTARRNADQATERATAATRDLTEAQQRLNTETRDGAEEASGWGDRVSGALGSVVGAAAGLAGVALGIEGLTQAFEQMDVGNKLAAQLGDGAETARHYGALAGTIYADNFGESIEDVEDALGSVAAVWGKIGDVGEEELQGLTEKALTFKQVFGTETVESVQTVSQLITDGLAADGVQAFDLLTASFQKVPKAMRDELPEIMNEYGKYFAQMGFDGKSAFEVLVRAANAGKFVLDKTGDAVLGFQDLVVQGGSAQEEAFKSLGMSWDKMSTEVASGGARAQAALQQTVAKLLEIEDPAERARLAVALFGEPMIELGTENIPKFLKSLQGGSNVLGDFTGATDEMAKTMAQGPAASLEAFQRAVQGAVVDKLGLATRILMDNKWAMYALAGAITAVVVGYGIIRAAAVTSAISLGIHTATANADTAALVTNRVAMGAHAVASGVMKAQQLASAAATAVATGATWSWTAALLASPVTWIVLGLAAVVAAIVLIATKTDWFQRLWRVCWDAIKSGASAVWEGFLKPAFDGIVTGLQWVGDKAMWLWSNAIQPAFSAIGGFLRQLWEGWIKPVFDGWVWVFQNVLGPAVSWLWESVLQPVFGAIGDFIGWIWNAILKPSFDGWVLIFQTVLAPVVTWLWESIIKPVFQAIGDFIGWVWSNLIKPVIDFMIDTFNAGLVPTLKKTGEFFYGLWNDWVKPALAWIGEKLQWLWQSVVQPVFSWIGEKLRDIAAGFGIFRDKVGEVVAWVGDKLAVLSRSFTSAKDKIVGVFSGAGKWLWDAGKNIIQGLLDGAGSLLSSIGNFFLDRIPGWIKDPFKKALGIASPSKVFRGFGIDIGSGLVAGIRSMHGQAAAATEGLAGAAVDAAAAMPAVAAPAMAPVAVDAAPAVAAAVPAVAPTEGVDAAAPLAASAAVIGDVAANQIGPALAGMTQGVTDFAAATQLQLASMVDPAWAATAANLTTVQTGVLSPAITAIQTATTGLAATTTGVVLGQINPAWSSVGANVLAVHTGTVSPVLGQMNAAIANTANAFGMGASNIATQWSRVREATASPVRFAISSVFNDGIVGMWNSVSDLLGTQKMGTYPIRFWAGGTVPGGGGPTADDVPAMLSSREFVAPVKMIEAVGGGSWSRGAGILDGMRRRVLGGGSMPSGPEGLFGRYAAGGVVQGTPAWESLKRGHAFAARHSGKPYVWGGSIGPSGGTDCSGYMSSIADVILGGDGLFRKWATGAFPGGGGSQAQMANAGGQTWLSGLASGFSIGVSQEHTAGTLGGVAGLPTVNVESGGSHGRVSYGGPAVGADHGQFPSRYHLPIAAGAFVSGGGGGGSAMSMGDIVGSITGPAWDKINAALAGFKGAGGIIDTYPPKVAGKLKDATTKRIDKLIAEMTTFADPGGAGVERWRPLVKLLLLRYKLGEENTDRTLRRMNQESGGNPRAINLWDSNAKAGIPSKGLMQVIDPTFAANRDPALSPDIWDPMANVAASMRYAMGQYGSLAAAYDRAGGYDLGGVAHGTGIMLKDVISPERVLSSAQTQSFDRLVGGLEAAGAGGDVRIGGLRIGSDGSMLLEGRTGGGMSADLAAIAAGGGARTTVQVTQHIYGPDSREIADEVAGRLGSLVM